MTFLKFIFVGIVNTMVGLSAIYLGMYYLRLEIVTANVFGYSIGILLGFFLNKRWTFSSQGDLIFSFLRYLLVLSIAYIGNLTAVLYVVSHFHLNPYIAQAVGVAPYTVIGFLGSRYFAFRSHTCVKSVPGHISKASVSRNKPLVSRMIDLSLVVPCFNEVEVLSETTRRLAELFEQLISENKITPTSRVCYIDDGSRDQTWDLIESLSQTHNFVHGIKLSRNRGHQNALLAGLLTIEGEVIISLDADLQDDLAAIRQMIEMYIAGYDIVYGVRDSRKTDTFLKSFTAKVYYHLLSKMGVEIIYNHADYRLMSRQVINALREFGEVNLFLRGIIPQLGFSHAIVYYDRAKRFAGESKYPFNRMLAFAWQGITSFSDIPLRLITTLGLLISLISFLISVWAVAIRLFTEQAVPGWASTVLPIYFLGGIQLLCLGIMAEYLAKIYAETKRRPRYIIEKII